MSHKTAATVARTIGIDTGKDTLHLIGLDDKGAIVLREKISPSQITARLANVPRYRNRSWHGDALCRASRPWLRRDLGVRNDAPKLPRFAEASFLGRHRSVER
jgi:hypothetical protein